MIDAHHKIKPILKITGLSKSFTQGDNRVEAVRNVDFAVEEGKVVAIMGPSGSGKSTLLHLIAGLTKPNNGTIEIENTTFSNMNDAAQTKFRRRRIGIVFQAYNLIPTLTAEQNITLPLAMEGIRKNGNDELDHMFDLLSLGHRRNHRPDSLSGGEQQRVAIARALITDPAVILADEPTGNLDTETTHQICKELKAICHDKGKTLLLVTHEPSVAFFADSICIMKDGKLGRQVDVYTFKTAEDLAMHYQAEVTGKEQPEACAC